MHEFFHSPRFKIIIVIVLLVFSGMLISAATYTPDSGKTSVVGSILSPLQKLANSVSDGVSSFFDGFRNADSYNSQIDELEPELAELRGQLADYETTKRKNQQYEEYLELKTDNPDFKFAEARVLSMDSVTPFSSFELDVGTSDGVSVNDPVIKGSYLAGVVVKVSRNSCVVNSILNPEVNVSAYEVRTGQTGVVTGDVELSSDGRCRMNYLSRDTAITTGNLICTSGVGGIFPNGLIIGYVGDVKNSEYDVSAYATIIPTVDFEELDEVFVITDFEGQGSGDEVED